MSTQSWTPPTAEQLSQVVATVVRPEQRRHFFDNLQNPMWVKPLADRGFSNDPPEPIRDNERGTIGFPSWPESRYLSRMASMAPEDVAAVVRNIRPTENARIQEDFLDALLAMPPETAATFVRDIARWMAQPNWLLVPEKVGRLIARLAKGGQSRAA